jgi:hypothetical protein
MPEFYWYPSIGNKGYPYHSWEFKRREYAWETLGTLAKIYGQICRLFRNKYRWSPLIVDKIDLNRILKIYDETIEDRPADAEEDEFE